LKKKQIKDGWGREGEIISTSREIETAKFMEAEKKHN